MINHTQIQKGSIVQFEMDWEKEPTSINTSIVLRIAGDRSWADVITPYGSKRVSNPDKNLKLITEPLVVNIG